MNWLMPPETDAQERIWMAFPPQGASVFEDAKSAHEARTAWAAVAHAIIDFEPVSMIVDPADRAVAPKYLSREIDVVEAPLDDAWMRDIGPTFVRGTDGRVAAVDWVFNGWGARDWARWDNDAHIGRFVGQLAGVETSHPPWSTKAEASRLTARARCWSPKLCSSIPRAIPGSISVRWRPSSRARSGRDT
ncbi:Putative agmatine deiminase [Mycobacteroides abscessus]|nr:Putative agmatine deiminase [Mycobacteroides abscessus]